MAFVPPVALIRRNSIIRRLRKHGAFSPVTALTFEEAGVINPNAFQSVTRRMLNKGLLHQCSGRYYLNTTK